MRILSVGSTPTIVLGPFVDKTDGFTPKTGLTVNQAAVRLSKNGATFAQKSSSATATHGENGYYLCALDATDTGTVGHLTVAVSDAAALPVRQDYMVLPAVVYNALVAGTGNGLRSEVVTVAGSTSAATNLAAGASTIITGTVTTTGFAPTATEFESSDVVNAPSDVLNGRIIVFTSGTYKDKATRITDYYLSSGRGHFVVESLGAAVPANNVTFNIY